MASSIAEYNDINISNQFVMDISNHSMEALVDSMSIHYFPALL